MLNLHVTPLMQQLMANKQLSDRPLLLITDDGGGRYSLSGGACTIGAKFSLIVLTAPDAHYPLSIQNDADWPLKTSDYDAAFMGPGLVLDYKNHQIQLRDNAGLLDSAVEIADGAAVLAAFNQGIVAKGESC